MEKRKLSGKTILKLTGALLALAYLGFCLYAGITGKFYGMHRKEHVLRFGDLKNWVSGSGDEKGRIEKGAAIAMLAKVYLYQHKYPEAKAQLQLLMNAPYYPGRYNLIENFAENFTTAKENNEESVFELQYSSDGELTCPELAGTGSQHECRF